MRFGVWAVFGEWSSAGASSAQPAGRFVESTTELKRYREAETRDAEPARPLVGRTRVIARLLGRPPEP